MSGVVDDGGQSGFPGKQWSGYGGGSCVGEGSVSDRCRVSERSGVSVSGISVSQGGGGEGSVVGEWSCVSEWSGGGRGVSQSDDASLGSSVNGQMCGSGCDDFRSVYYWSWTSSGSDGESVAGNSVSGTVGDVVGSQNLTVRSYIAERSDFVSESVLNGGVGLERFGVSVAGLAEFILRMILALDSGWSGDYCWGGDGCRGGQNRAVGVRVDGRVAERRVS